MQVRKFILIAAGLLPAVLAQTTSDCNPLKGCFKDDPALGTTYVWDYTKEHGAAPRFDIVSSASRISYQGDGMHMSVTMKGDSPTLQSQFYIFWGRAEIVMKAGPGAGIVSSLVMQSDDLDEIDVEFIGNQPGNVQTNIFSKGNQDVHIYGANTGVADTVGNFHKYTIDWTPQAITWYIDGAPVRTLVRADLGDVYPQTPMQIKFGPWAAGDPSNAPGTIEWAGGEIDYSQAPFDMVVASLSITDYSAGATMYRYKDSSGSSGSIEVIGGGSVKIPEPEPTSQAPPPPPPTTTKAPPPPPTTTSKPPPPPPSTTSTPPPPPPEPTTTSSKSIPPPPPPPPTTSLEPTTTTTTTSTSTTEEPETTTSTSSKLNIQTKIVTHSSSASTSKPPPEPTSSEEEKKETTTKAPPSKSTFVVETTSTDRSKPEETTLSTSTVVPTKSASEKQATNSDVPNSGSNIQTASSLIIAITALFILF